MKIHEENGYGRKAKFVLIKKASRIVRKKQTTDYMPDYMPEIRGYNFPQTAPCRCVASKYSSGKFARVALSGREIAPDIFFRKIPASFS